MTAELPFDTHTLGTLYSEHRLSQTSQKFNRYVGYFLLLAGVITLIGSFFLITVDGGAVALVSGLGLFVALAGGWSILSSKRGQHLVIRTFANGFTYSDHTGHKLFHWDNITAVKMGIVNNRKARVNSYTFTIQDNTGQNFTFTQTDTTLEGLKQLSDTIQNEVTHRLLPQTYQKFQAGGTVEFGLLQVSQAGLGNGKETIPWAEVEEVKLNNGTITVRKAGKWLNWSQVTVGGTPNIYVFLSLVDQLVGVNRKK